MTHRSGRIGIRLGVAVVMFAASFLAGSVWAQAQTHAYIANANANLVTVIDTATNAVAGTIDVGAQPTSVAISKDGSRAYVANTGSSSLSVINTATRTVIATIPVAAQPGSIAVAADGARVYVLGASGVLDVIDTASNAVTQSLEVGAGGGQIAITPDGSRLYVASETISVIDTGTSQIVASFAPELISSVFAVNYAVAVAVSPDGARAYVAFITYSFDFAGFSAGGGVAVIDTTTNQVIEIIPLFSLPESIALTADGSRAYVGIEAYWVDTGYGAGFLQARHVAAIDTATNEVVGWADLGAAGSVQRTPSGLAVTPDRTAVYVAVPATESVVRIDTATNLVTAVLDIEGGPVWLAIVPDAAVKPARFSIEAGDDSSAAAVPALSSGRAVKNVLANDTIGGAPAAIGNVALSLVSSTNPGVVLDEEGAVWVLSGTEIGSHELTYQICEAGNGENCDQALVTVRVRAPFVIAAAEDRATSYAGASAIATVVANDTLDNLPAALGAVALSVVSSDAGLSLSASDGSVAVAAGTAVGDHSLVYRICEVADPANCADGSATVSVIARVIRAESDRATAPRTGANAIVNVLANDTLGGTAATLSRVTLSKVSSTDAGITLNAATGAVSVAAGTATGAQSLLYRICETASAGNCAEGTVAVTVNAYLVTAVNDQARASSKNASTAIRNVLANDSIGGAPATLANVRLSLVSMSPSNSRIRLNSDGSVEVQTKAGSGLYTLQYQICEVGNATNCGRATISLDLSGRD